MKSRLVALSMASVVCQSLTTGEKLVVPPLIALDFIRKCEKSSFSRAGALDFDSELKKRNAEVVVFLDGNISSHEPPFIAYILFAHVKAGNAIALHKICVKKEHRSQGLGSQALVQVIDSLRKRGKLSVQLWVNDRNTVAQALYRGAGFETMSEVEGYYGPGQNGVNMKLIL